MRTQGKIRLSNGAKAEIEFQKLCAELDLECCKPFIEGMPYDFVVRGISKGNQFRTVQVKSSFKKDEDNHKINLVKSGPNRTKQAYKKGDFDYLAVYRTDTKDWYIIPYSKVSHITCTLGISYPKWEEYKVSKNDSSRKIFGTEGKKPTKCQG